MSDLKDDEVSLEDNSASVDLADELYVDHMTDIEEARVSQSYVQSDNSLTEKHKKKRKRPKYAKRDFPSDSSESESEDYSHSKVWQKSKTSSKKDDFSSDSESDKEGFTIRSIDPLIFSIMEEQSRSTNTQLDKAFVSIQTKLIDTMGPLGNLWMLFEDIRSKIDKGCDDPSAQAQVDNVDFRHILDLLEKTICLVGQSNVTINYQRRLSILQRINNQDSKKARSLLRDKQECLAKNGKRLFGSEFKEELKEWSKTGKKKSRKKKVINYDTPRQVQQSQRWEQKESHQDKPPFQSRPPSHSQVARNSGDRGNSRGNGFHRGNKRGGIRYVKFCFKSLSHKKSRQNKQYFNLIGESKPSDTIKTHSYRRKVKPFCKELGNNHLREKDTKRYPKYRGKFSVTSDTTERYKNNCTQSKRRTPDVNRGQRNVDKRSHCTSKTMQGSIPKQLVLSTQKRWGQRPVLNLKILNQHVMYQHFKMEGLFMIKDLLKVGDFMLKIDLKEAYSVLSISQNHRKFLRFKWEGTLFEYTALPFGLAEGPRLFTKIMKPVIGILRRMGVRMIIYLDDILLMAENPQKLEIHRNSTLFLLQKLGFLINWKKSSLNPTQKIEFLGFKINSVEMMFYLSKEKVSHIKTKCREISADIVTVMQLTQLTGKLSSSMQAIFPANLQSRFLQMDQIKGLLKGKSYEQKIILSQTARDEIIWWVTKIEEFNGKAIITPCPDNVITSDASNLGWGLLFKTKGEPHPLIQTGSLNFVAWKISGDEVPQRDYQKQLQSCMKKHADQEPNWGKWVSWCSEQSVNPFQAPLATVIEFLTKLFRDGLQYRTINTYRSAISKNHPLIDSLQVGKHPLIIRHMRAIFNERTPTSEYEFSWDVDIVLNEILSWGTNQALDIKHLSWKLVMLLALSSAGRASE
ncbi:unnamed protein product [Mytilus coruscus]|uniref:Reverse transcriptase domain-containing protein n=1 Tax=Mytilus coruscus TaxID=42192 RepID=A0A6J8CDJ6_MYTCO|nr:unnamed protein product [Mytilus coruscus]